MNYHDKFLSFWIITPIKKNLAKVKRFFINKFHYTINKFHYTFGYWYCGRCKKYHSARVINYCNIDVIDGNCDQNFNIEEELKDIS